MRYYERMAIVKYYNVLVYMLFRIEIDNLKAVLAEFRRSRNSAL